MSHALILTLLAAPALAGGGADDTYESKIRPLLVKNCGQCHAPDDPESDFVATTPEGLLAGSISGEVILPGNVDGSRLIEVVRYRGTLRMPPAGRLADEEIALLEDWVERGAPMPEVQPGAVKTRGFDWQERLEHWLWQEPVDPEVPAVQKQDWPRGPVDHFVLAALEREGLQPQEEAERRSWPGVAL